MSKFDVVDIADDCDCPNKSGGIKMSLYLIKDISLTEPVKSTKIATVLMSMFEFTESQANMAIKFTNRRGECLIYTGDNRRTVELLELLSAYNINCDARMEGVIK